MQNLIEQPKANKRVIIGMSGGVDSSVAAKLLLDDGYDVLGVTMKLVPDSKADESNDACGSTNGQEDASRVAKQLGISHKFFGFEGEFDRDVVTPFCRDYLAGKTPNPCVSCNRYLKFGVMQNCRKELGYDYVATGHYVRRTYSNEYGRYLLLRGVDEEKDQSYFLYHLSQEVLANTLFPLGEFTKPKIREIAADSGLVVAKKPESQDICFVDGGDYIAFIEKHECKQLEPGPIVNTNGDVLGQHRGLARYTIGQRKGLCVSYSEPLFVLKKDAANNALVVGTAAQQGIRELWANEINLISCDDIPKFTDVQVKVIYRQRPVLAQARVERTAGEEPLLHVVFDTPIKACASGQAVVLYDGDIVIGGGNIVHFA